MGALSSAPADQQIEVPEGDFFARQLTIAALSTQVGIEKIVLVHRLREVMAQVGFTRFQPDGTNIHGELEENIRTAQLATDVHWLPAVVNRGEGVFLQLSGMAVQAWLQRPEVVIRGEELRAGFLRWRKRPPVRRAERRAVEITTPV